MIFFAQRISATNFRTTFEPHFGAQTREVWFTTDRCINTLVGSSIQNGFRALRVTENARTNGSRSVRHITGNRVRAFHSCAARVDRKQSLASARVPRKLVLSMKRRNAWKLASLTLRTTWPSVVSLVETEIDRLKQGNRSSSRFPCLFFTVPLFHDDVRSTKYQRWHDGIFMRHSDVTKLVFATLCSHVEAKSHLSRRSFAISANRWHHFVRFASLSVEHYVCFCHSRLETL